MQKCSYSLFVLLFGTTLAIDTFGESLSENHFNGMQLAWVKLPSTPATQEGTDTTTAQSPAPKPVKPPVAKPIQPPVAQPIQPLEVKSIQSPVVQPIKPLEVTPVQSPVAKPFQPLEVKPVQAPASKPVQHSFKATHALEWVFGVGADFGGEELGTVSYSDGTSASVKANNGIVFNAGCIIANGEGSAFSTQMTLGYKSGGPRVWSREVNWSAVPLEVIELYRSGSTRLGLGISYQINPQLNVSLPSSTFANKYNNALGTIVQIGWVPAKEHYSIDLRFTSIKFQSSDVQNAPVIDGNVGGVYLNYYY